MTDDALTRLADKATPGPWMTSEDEFGIYVEQAPGTYDGYIVQMERGDEYDARLIALAPELARVAIQLAAALHALTPEPNTSGGSEIPNARAALAAYQELVDRSKLLDAFAAARGNEEETDA